MAKCPICNSKKGDRPCLIAGSSVCSLCCGTTRNLDACLGCRFYQKPKRRYSDAPAYAVHEMEDGSELASYGNSIEGALCSYDIKIGNNLKDSEAIRVLEALIDLHYFGDQCPVEDSPIITNGVAYVENVIAADLNKISNETVVKLLGVIRFVAKRRAKNGRDYLNIIHQYVGQRIGTGMRIMKM